MLDFVCKITIECFLDPLKKKRKNARGNTVGFFFPDSMSKDTENYGDRPAKLIAAFKALDKNGTGKVPTPSIAKLLSLYAPDMTADEKQEFFTEADEKGFVVYEEFVKEIIFGKIKL